MRDLAWFVWLLPRNVGVVLIRAYRAIVSPLYGDVCRYYPTCSAYGLTAVQHRGLVVGSGLVVALSGLWMAQFYELPELDGALLYAFRLLFGWLMAAAIVLGFAAIRRGDVRGHRAWMMRGYAIGLGAGTQVLTLLAGEMVAGPPSVLGRALLMGAGWAINLAIAEWIIRRRPARSARTAAAVGSLDRDDPQAHRHGRVPECAAASPAPPACGGRARPRRTRGPAWRAGPAHPPSRRL